MNKINKIIKIFVIITFIIITSLILILNIKELVLNKNIISLLIAIILLVLGYFLINKLKQIQIKSKKITTIIILIISLTLLMMLGLMTRVTLGWDYGRVITTAFDLEKNNLIYRGYFARYPNNLILLGFENIIAKIVLLLKPSITLIGFNSVLVIVNAFIVISNIFILNYLIYKKIGKTSALISITLSFLYSPLYLYTAIMYTDTTGMFLSLIALFLYYIYEKAEGKIKILSFIFMILSITIGFKFKATNLFMIIALTVEFFLNKKYKEIIASFILLIIFLIPINLGLKSILNLTEEEMESYNFPYTHWVMMALNPKLSGGYSQSDVDFTASFKTIDERKEANVKIIKERVDEFGFKNLINRILIVKNTRTWTNSTLATEDYLGRKPRDKNIINDTVTSQGKYYKYYRLYINSIWIILIIGLLISSYFEIKKHNNFVFISQLLIIGLFIFELIWECNSRYVYTFLPFIFIPASSAYANILKTIKEKKA